MITFEPRAAGGPTADNPAYVHLGTTVHMAARYNRSLEGSIGGLSDPGDARYLAATWMVQPLIMLIWPSLPLLED
jgi:hypothetical protein